LTGSFSAFLKCGLHAEDFAQGDDLLKRSNSPESRGAASNEIDDAVCNQRNDFVGMRKYFADGLRRRADLPYLLIPGDLLRR